MKKHEVGFTCYPVKKDKRYKITRNWTGKLRPVYSLYFCDEYIGESPHLDGAVKGLFRFKLKREKRLEGAGA